MKALIVDDSALMRRRISQILLQHGFETRTARNGVDALEALGSFQPDVVTLDINMPEMDGLTCLSHIMADRPTPVVMISSLTSGGALATLEAIELGAVDYVQKPGGTVSVNIDRAADEIAAKVKAAAGARMRPTRGLRERLTAERDHILKERRSTRAPGSPNAEALVLVGASTGGPRVLEEILVDLPAEFPLPILICQHMPATMTPHFAERLGQITALPVEEVVRMTHVEPGRVYLGRGDADMIVLERGGRLAVTAVPLDPAFSWHPSVGRMVASAMQVVTPDALIGVMMTGMGNDGAEEMSALHRAGGLTLAESEETAVVFGMPKALIAQGGAQKVLPSNRVARQVTEWAAQIAAAAAR